jgi:hypothetical protein
MISPPRGSRASNACGMDGTGARGTNLVRFEVGAQVQRIHVHDRDGASAAASKSTQCLSSTKQAFPFGDGARGLTMCGRVCMLFYPCRVLHLCFVHPCVNADRSGRAGGGGGGLRCDGLLRLLRHSSHLDVQTFGFDILAAVRQQLDAVLNRTRHAARVLLGRSVVQWTI